MVTESTFGTTPGHDRLERNDDSHASNGGRLVAIDGKELPLRRTTLRADARAGIARVVIEQVFSNRYAEPLEVTYQLPLPHDGAVSGFRFQIGDTVVVGEVDRKQAARERFERAIVEGRTAALLEQVRASVFTQRVGNIPPGAEITVEISVDQRLLWIDDGSWEWRFPTVVGPRYMGAAGRVSDAAALEVDVADGTLAPRVAMSLRIGDERAENSPASSPSHALESRTVESGSEISLREGRTRADRDIVVRWKVANHAVSVSLVASRPASGDAAYGLLTIVPPATRNMREVTPRDVIVLIDTSGSMGGAPLEQAQRVVSALIDTLTDVDQLELIEFSTATRRWRESPCAASRTNRSEAIAWVRALRAGGGTEMHRAVLEALEPIRKGTQRQVVLVTDGYIGFEDEILRTVYAKLPSGCRFHTVGVGSSVNRSLTNPAARAGRGVEVVIGIDEDPERACRRIVARTDGPIVTDVEISGDALIRTAPSRIPDLFAGAPLLCSLQLRPSGGEIVVRGKHAGKGWEHRMTVAAPARGTENAAVCALFAREAVEDLELERAAERGRNVDPEIEKLGIEFQIATRLTSWIAVTAKATVDGQSNPRRETMPQELPHGTSIVGLGLRSTAQQQSAVLFSLKELAQLHESAHGYAAAPQQAGMPPSMPMPTGSYSARSPERLAAIGAPKRVSRSRLFVGIVVILALLALLAVLVMRSCAAPAGRATWTLDSRSALAVAFGMLR